MLALTFLLLSCTSTPEPDCAADTLRDSAGACVPAACGTDAFPALDGEVVYVLAGSDGDGSREHPFGSVGEALGGSTIAIGAGVYTENLELADQSLVGRCPELVRLEAADPTLPLIDVSAGDAVSLSGLTLRGGRPGVFLHEGTLALQDSVVEDTEGAGVACEDLSANDEAVEMSLRQVTVQGNRYFYGFSEAFQYGAGVGAINCVADLDRVSLEENAAAGLFAYGSRVDIRRSSVARSRAHDGDSYPGGYGMQLGESYLTVDEVELSDNLCMGLDLVGVVNTTLHNLTVRGTRDLGRVCVGSAVYLFHDGNQGSVVDIDGLWIEDSIGVGMTISDSMVTARDVHVARLSESHYLDMPDGGGVMASGVGLLVSGSAAPGRSRMDGVQISDVRMAGIVVMHGGEVEVEGGQISGVRRLRTLDDAVGVLVASGGAFLGTDLEISEVEGPGCAASYGSLSCSACSVHDTEFAGIIARNGAHVELSGGTEIRDNLPGDQGGGYGIYTNSIYGAPHLVLDDVLVGPHVRAAVMLRGAGPTDPGSLSLSNSTLYGSDNERADRPAGNALVVAFSTLEAVSVQDSTLRGSSTEALLVHAADLSLDDVQWRDDAVNARWQDCPPDLVPHELPNSSFCQGYDLPWTDVLWWYDQVLTEYE